jgi:hypothetical protein
MKRFLLMIIATALLSGCAELRVIGSAAMTELNAEAINVEVAAYQPKVTPQAPAAPKKIVAKADLNPFLRQPVKLAAATPQRGQWEGRQ